MLLQIAIPNRASLLKIFQRRLDIDGICRLMATGPSTIPFQMGTNLVRKLRYSGLRLPKIPKVESPAAPRRLRELHGNKGNKGKRPHGCRQAVHRSILRLKAILGSPFWHNPNI